MKSRVYLPGILICLLASACSGLIPGFSSEGKIVSPSYLAQYRGGGSMSTLWYRGSDAEYHYFAHYMKVSSLYRVPREELQVPGEFPYKSRKSVSVGDAPYWRNL